MQKDTAVFKFGDRTGMESTIAHLVQEASAFSAAIYLQKGERRANAKSLLGMISLGMMPGDELTILAEGEDANKAIQALKSFLEGEKK